MDPGRVDAPIRGLSKPPWLATLRTGTDGASTLGKLGRKRPRELPRSKMPVHSSAQHYATVIAENERLRTTGARLREWWPESGNSLAGHNKEWIYRRP